MPHQGRLVGTKALGPPSWGSECNVSPNLVRWGRMRCARVGAEHLGKLKECFIPGVDLA